LAPYTFENQYIKNWVADVSERLDLTYDLLLEQSEQIREDPVQDSFRLSTNSQCVGH